MYTYIKNYGPLNKRHLKRIKQTIDKALNEHDRVMAVRVDLHAPVINALNDIPTEDDFACIDAAVISRFMTSLKEQIKNHLIKLERDGYSPRKTSLRFIWSREFCPTTHKKHYHTLLLLNRDTFCYVGSYGSDNGSLVRFIRRAWKSATGLSYERSIKLVAIPANPCYYLKAKDGDQSEPYRDLIYRTSYFAKYQTKCLTDGERNFGCSQG
ncbi:inovirus Gp2 family protein [Enterobacter hormaechei]|uniref:inovirus Gp2 family protein n=1 Tax=Enterobacter hormaechei TaxID=158836 RepID=UPI00277C7A8C|nr:inovirus Gp2 family protein [Enterobacter hormaechei]MDY3572494.1 inovirus Gp2 family protein [Enterobacter hormaechei]HDS5593147.1 inovirus Gp2 family protein [Enterobacter hormaechei subsp. xiangfangensis]